MKEFKTDKTVYKTGLRMIGSNKKLTGSIHYPYYNRITNKQTNKIKELRNYGTNRQTNETRAQTN